VARPGAGQLLVQVLAAGVQPVDLEVRRGERADWGYTFPLILGTDVSGVVAAGDGGTGVHQNLASFVKAFVKEPTTMPWGNRSLLFRDPDGNLVNFFAPVTPAAIQKFAR
jgi:hypothetical protein